MERRKDRPAKAATREWLPMPFTGQRGGNLRKERDDYYSHLAAHPDTKAYLAGFRRPTRKMAEAVWRLLSRRLRVKVDRLLPSPGSCRPGDELTAKQASARAKTKLKIRSASVKRGAAI